MKRARTKRDVLLCVNLLQTNGELLDMEHALRKAGFTSLANCFQFQRRAAMRKESAVFFKVDQRGIPKRMKLSHDYLGHLTR